MTELTLERLREVLDYDPETGIFTRKVRLAQRHQVGDRADTEIKNGEMKGYRRVGLFSKRYLAHRLAWFYVHGVWPTHEIDHWNGHRGDNWISNLRDVTGTVNNENKRRPRADNTSGFLGVSWDAPCRRWVAKIQVKRKTMYLGLHDTPELAHAAYVAAKRKYHEGCTL